MAWTSVMMEPGRCLTGEAAYRIEMDTEDWVDTGAYRTAVLEVNTPRVSGCTLLVEGCETFGGQWTEIASLSVKGDIQCLLRRSAPMGSSERLPKYLRWRVDGPWASPPGPWSLTFRIALVLKD